VAVDTHGRWIAGIGDPSLVGWVTVGAYALAALLAARNAAAARRAARPVAFWWTLLGLLLLLGVNKQLDLQTWFGQTGRDMALSQGWYERRRGVQALFIALLCGGAATMLIGARRYWRGLWPEYRGVFAGLLLLAVFVVIRAASFHHTDELIGLSLGTTTAGRALEVVGVVLIAWACMRWHGRQRDRATT
jgi:hypothetical protein